MRNYANAKFFVVDAACIEESGNDFTLALQSFQMMFSARIIVILSGYEDVNGEVQRLLSIGVVNLVTVKRWRTPGRADRSAFRRWDAAVCGKGSRLRTASYSA